MTFETVLKTDLKNELDTLCVQYETADFIKDDPVQFVHLFKNRHDIEIAGFIAALFAFGKREVFIKKLFTLFNLMEMKPFDFISNYKSGEDLGEFNYRFIKPYDLNAFLCALKKLYTVDKMTLEELFSNGYSVSKTVSGALQFVCDYFYADEKNSPGYKFMLSNPLNKGAMKRMNMFLRWMIRKNSLVDIGVWDFLDASELLIPLDVHVGNISRGMGILKRNQNDYKAVIELTSKLKEFDPNDPVKYDFALFGYGVNLSKKETP